VKVSTYIRKEGTNQPDTRWDGRVRNEVYDPDSLSWIAQTSDASGEIDVAGLSTNVSRVMTAVDKVRTFTWSDFGAATQRIATIVYSSASVGKTVTDTFAYTLVSAAYRLDTITRVVS